MEGRDGWNVLGALWALTEDGSVKRLTVNASSTKRKMET